VTRAELATSTGKQLFVSTARCALLVYGLFTVTTAIEAGGFWGSWLTAGIALVAGALGFAWVARTQEARRGWRHLPSWLLVLGALVLLVAVAFAGFGVVCDDQGFSCGW
jgi:hypothetical protein